MRIILLSALPPGASPLLAQKSYTVQITATNIDTKVLREGTHRYPVLDKNN